jgi:hypothetical protein
MNMSIRRGLQQTDVGIFLPTNLATAEARAQRE